MENIPQLSKLVRLHSEQTREEFRKFVVRRKERKPWWCHKSGTKCIVFYNKSVFSAAFPVRTNRHHHQMPVSFHIKTLKLPNCQTASLTQECSCEDGKLFVKASLRSWGSSGLAHTAPLSTSFLYHQLDSGLFSNAVWDEESISERECTRVASFFNLLSLWLPSWAAGLQLHGH